MEQDDHKNAATADEKSASTVEQQKDTIFNSVIDKESPYIVGNVLKTFQELHISLDNEEAKLMELEARHRALQDEMVRIKAEILKEKNHIQDNLMQSELELNYETRYEQMDEIETS